jgi:hypothetical protein
MSGKGLTIETLTARFAVLWSWGTGSTVAEKKINLSSNDG